MGMFDTFYFKAVVCKSCGNEIKNTQSKKFLNHLMDFREGESINNEIGSYSGIVEETLYCDTCKQAEQKIYLLIEKNIYFGAFETIEEAQSKVERIDTEFIMKMYEEKSNEARALQLIVGRVLRYLRDTEEAQEIVIKKLVDINYKPSVFAYMGLNSISSDITNPMTNVVAIRMELENMMKRLNSGEDKGMDIF